MSGSRGISLSIFIASTSGRKIITSFAYRFFHFIRPPGLRLAFDAAERNGKFGRIQCQKGKECSSRGREKKASVPLQMDGESRSKGKVIPTSFLKIIEMGDVRWGGRAGKV